MANRKGNTGMAALGRVAAARRVEKIDQVLLWVYRWGWSHEHIIQKLLGLTRRPCAALVKQGVLKRIEPEPGFKAAYVLGAAHIDRAQDLHEAETQGRIALEYTQHRTSIPWLGLVIHNEMAQVAALSELKDLGGLLITGDELRVKTKPGDAIPDFVIEDGESTTWYELERTKKYRERLAQQLAQRNEALRRHEFDRMIWVCGSEGVMNHVAEALEQKRVVNVLRRGDGRLCADLSCEGWDPKRLRDVTEFRLFQELIVE